MIYNYYALVMDSWDCELDYIGPFLTREEAETAAWEKWDGDENMYTVAIILKKPFKGLTADCR